MVNNSISTIGPNSFNPFLFYPGFPIQKVANLAESLPKHCWEYGATSEALLELYDPQYSIFGSTPFQVPASYVKGGGVRALEYAASKIRFGTGYNALCKGEGSAGDPSSLGVSAVMLGKSDERYAKATVDTIEGVLTDVPRFPNGAISHRFSVAELWADFVYMLPPFMAYYGAAHGNLTILEESVKQCQLYREVLMAKDNGDRKGLWMHIIGPQSQDKGLWSTGNAWAAAGMTRVLATVMKGPSRDTPWGHQAMADLGKWIMEILEGAMETPKDGGLEPNYLDDPRENMRGFGETSGSSMLAAVAYRMAVLQPSMCGKKHVRWADLIRSELGEKDENGEPHVTEDGIVTPAVNPYAWKDTKPFTSGSPEGQAFVVLMYAAWRDCVDADICRGP